MDIRFLGQSCFELSTDSASVLVDPFLTGNPKGAIEASEVEKCDAILLTHGHADHFGDTVDIAKRTGATVVTIVETAQELMNEHGLENVKDPNMGGTVEFDWGWVRLVPAWHTSTTPSGTVAIPTGLVISIGGQVIYHLGDTCLFSDLALPGKRDPIDIAIVPIGGHYTMDRVDAVTAVEFVGCKTVIPCHYDTFPPIETDADAFKSDVESKTSASCVILQPGETHSV